MKAITLWQPWASLIAHQLKQVETRSWSTEYRGLLAIHAGKRFNTYQKHLTLHDPRFRDPLKRAGALLGAKPPLPLGKVVAIVELTDVRQITWNNRPQQESAEFTFGDFTPGRFMWFLKLIQRLEKPIPARGYQGLWGWSPPESLLPVLEKAQEPA